MNDSRSATPNVKGGFDGDNAALVPPARDWVPRRQLPFLGLMVLTVFAVFFCYQLVQPFLTAVLWAIAFAILANPFYRWLLRIIRIRSLASGIAVAAVALVIVLPAVALAPKLAGDTASAVNSVTQSLGSGQWREKLSQVNALSAAINWMEAHVDFRELFHEIAYVLTTAMSTVLKGSVAGIGQLIVGGFLLFYLFRDQDEALAALRSLLPVAPDEADMLFCRFSDTVYALIYGKMLTAVVQGALGGVSFWIFGLPAPWFWGLMMGMLSFLPMVGASLVWGPAAVILALDGYLGKSILLVMWGVLIIAPIESFLYPILVGRRLKLHDALVFIALLGGMFAFGPVGLFIGPAILALTLGLISLWKERLSTARVPVAEPMRGESTAS
ncbi:MAG: hypothetical protein A2X45_12485 [Lentisphaerae bacterium GWF2_50_93]|nr:MAG: hypothetical protein A2X45_12485 [Lentisphaerae bacterium GWF2_50_93]